MLNKNQSHKETLEVCSSTTCSVGFTFLFQVEVVAQEKEQKSNH
jgi:hypothetical protein